MYNAISFNDSMNFKREFYLTAERQMLTSGVFSTEIVVCDFKSGEEVINQIQEMLELEYSEVYNVWWEYDEKKLIFTFDLEII